MLLGDLNLNIFFVVFSLDIRQVTIVAHSSKIVLEVHILKVSRSETLNDLFVLISGILNLLLVGFVMDNHGVHVSLFLLSENLFLLSLKIGNLRLVSLEKTGLGSLVLLSLLLL